jgi:hypothetical protein
LGVPKRRGVEHRRNDLRRGAPGVEAHVARHAALDDLPQGRDELARFLRTEKAGQGLLDDLILTKAQQVGHGVIGLEDFALKVGDENRIRRVPDQALGVATRLVELAHIAKYSDDADKEAITTRASRVVQRSTPTIEMRASYSMTIPLSKTRSMTSIAETRGRCSTAICHCRH